MPELPEVETVRRTLSKILIGRRIVDIKAPYEKIIKNTTLIKFRNALYNEQCQTVHRIGKYLIFIFNDVSVVAHLRMEGKFYFKSAREAINKHEHVIFVLDNNQEFRYHDTRKFGEMHLIYSTNLEDIIANSPIHKLGKEPFDWIHHKNEFFSLIHHRKTSIKAILLNQEVIAGLGNIYVDEVCFLSNIHPATICKDLSIDDTTNILENAIIVLQKAINLGGTTIRSYTSSDGVHGRFQNELFVHSRSNEACLKCATIIKKIRVAGRGTYYCEKCQIMKSQSIEIKQT
jgi:formamidopyrimidine-DNA glycosylase